MGGVGVGGWTWVGLGPSSESPSCWLYFENFEILLLYNLLIIP